jgi:hypothetical protein
MNERLIRSLAGVFHRHGLASEVSDGDVTRATELPLLGNIVHILVPNHVLFSDAERIYQGNDIVALVNGVSRITNGMWNPDNLTATFDRESSAAIVKFEHHGQACIWEYEQGGDYVSPAFFEALYKFAEKDLDGRFFDCGASMGQEFYLLFLPQSAASDYEGVLKSFAPSSDELAAFVTTVDEWAEEGYTGWFLIREALRPLNLENIDEPTADGSSVLSIVRDMAKSGSSNAQELEFALIELGADPETRRKKRGFWSRKK